MIYVRRTLGYWFGYVWPVFFVALVVDGVLALLLSLTEGALVRTALALWSLSTPGLGGWGPTPLAFCIPAAPLLNLYVAVVAAKSAIDADDDYHFYRDDERHPLPTARTRKNLIMVLSFASAFVLLPFVVWAYTESSPWLWPDEGLLLTKPGILLSLVLTAVAYWLLVSRYPRVASTLAKLRAHITHRPAGEHSRLRHRR